ncbi:hypothetical protein GON06_08630 [Microbacterium sp. MAH-37]|nr:hypothetical protein [Microbacterium sp. MAH-37]
MILRRWGRPTSTRTRSETSSPSPASRAPPTSCGRSRNRLALMSDLQVLRARHDVIAALLVAAENAEHVMRICSSAAPDAADELVRTFGVSDLQAQAILEMQLRRFAPEAAAAMRAELVEVSRRISEIEAR